MISIVTPSFRQLDWLRLAVASVADQQGVDVEHIIQDGGTEGIRESLEKTMQSLARDHYRVQLFVEKDQGMYDAINRGLRRAGGEIFGYLNCDEQYLPGALDKVENYFKIHPEIDVLFGDAIIVDSNGQALAYRRAIAPTLSHIRASHLNVYTCAMFFRRRIVETGHTLDPKWKSIGDAIWIYGILKAGLQIGILPEFLSIFTLTGQNLSTQNPVSKIEKKAWLAETGSPSPAARLWFIALHRLRKLLAGAYRRHTFEYEIYTLRSPRQRTRFRAKALGGTWPRVTK